MPEPTERPFRLLFVCTGNTCRSPMAEVIARRAASERGLDIEVASAGVAAPDGIVASGGSIRAAESHGLDLSEHRSTQLTGPMAADSDLILTMSAGHLMTVVELGLGDRAAVITSFAGEAAAAGVPDPIGGPDSEYVETFLFLERLIERSLDRIEEALR